jgi:hypothetical protein
MALPFLMAQQVGTYRSMLLMSHRGGGSIFGSPKQIHSQPNGAVKITQQQPIH